MKKTLFTVRPKDATLGEHFNWETPLVLQILFKKSCSKASGQYNVLAEEIIY